MPPGIFDPDGTFNLSRSKEGARSIIEGFPKALQAGVSSGGDSSSENNGMADIKREGVLQEELNQFTDATSTSFITGGIVNISFQPLNSSRYSNFRLDPANHSIRESSIVSVSSRADTASSTNERMDSVFHRAETAHRTLLNSIAPGADSELSAGGRILNNAAGEASLPFTCYPTI
jgi:hypothetical protein